LSALRWARRSSFSRCFICLAFSRSRLAIVVFPGRPMIASFVQNARWNMGYFVALRRRVALDIVPFAEERVGASFVLDRDVVSGPKPWLASDVTCRRISSIERD